MKIRTQERVVTCIAFVVITSIAGLILWTYTEVNVENTRRQQASEIARALSQLRLLTFEYRLYHSERAKTQWYEVSNRLDRLIADTQASIPAQAQLFARIAERRKKVVGLFTELTSGKGAALAGAPLDESTRLFESTLLSRLLAEQQENFVDVFRLTDIASQRIKDAQQRLLLVSLAGLVLIALTIAFASWLMNHAVLAPIQRLRRATSEIGAGNWKFKLDSRAKDEMGELGASFNSMAERIEAQSTALQTARDEALAASRMKSEFLANMSHELRTPLNGIIGFSEFIFDEKPGKLNDKQKEYLNDILNSARHLLQLINDVLDLSKVEAGKMELFLETFPVQGAIEEVCSALSHLAKKKNIAIRKEIAPAMEFVTLDQQKFKQVLYNLVSNGVKFTGDGGSVAIAIDSHEPGWIRLQVQDTGIGIKPEDLGKLFLHFQQLDSGLARRHEGTGLGLALTRRIVELQHGTITVKSQPGKGTVLVTLLPLGTGQTCGAGQTTTVRD